MKKTKKLLIFKNKVDKYIKKQKLKSTYFIK